MREEACTLSFPRRVDIDVVCHDKTLLCVGGDVPEKFGRPGTSRMQLVKTLGASEVEFLSQSEQPKLKRVHGSAKTGEFPSRARAVGNINAGPTML